MSTNQQLRDAQEAPFEQWWEKHGQLGRAGAGQYEKTFAWNAWCAASSSQPMPEAAQQGWKLVPVEPTPEMCRALFRNLVHADDEARVIKAVIAASPAAPEVVKPDLDGEAFRTAARFGLTLRFYGGCAQSGLPGSPSAYEVVTGSDMADAMRQAVRQAAKVIANGGDSQMLQPTEAAQPQAQGEPEAWGVWLDGEPPHPWREEWFIAETIYGDRVVLRYMGDDLTYQYKTADETYMVAKNIKRWMQFPDGQYISAATKAIAKRDAALVACVEAAQEMQASVVALFPTFEQGHAAQQAWQSRKDSAFEGVSAAITQANEALGRKDGGV